GARGHSCVRRFAHMMGVHDECASPSMTGLSPVTGVPNSTYDCVPFGRCRGCRVIAVQWDCRWEECVWCRLDVG
ncbi:MAG: hypothetical protein ACPGTU_18540, partial [Myxococcota bacterium]